MHLPALLGIAPSPVAMLPDWVMDQTFDAVCVTLVVMAVFWIGFGMAETDNRHRRV